jgi:hypothetical protein
LNVNNSAPGKPDIGHREIVPLFKYSFTHNKTTIMKRTKMPDELKRFTDPGDSQDEKPEGETEAATPAPEEETAEAVN